MPATNDILPFAQAGGANVLSQSAYLAHAQRTAGNQPGVALAQLVNKALLQASAISAGIAQFCADWQGTNVTDALTAAQLSTVLENAITAAAGFRFNGGILRTTSGYVMTAADASNVLLSQVAGAASHTLPAISACKPGQVFAVKNTGLNTVTMNRAGADNILVGSTTSNSLAVQAGEEAFFVVPPSGSSWYAFGSGTLYKNANFASSLVGGSGGYQKLPGGFIIQWVSGTVGSGSDLTLNFPITFPNAIMARALCARNGVGSTNTVVTAGAESLSSINLGCYLGNTGARISQVADAIVVGF